jgi:hypothetical protein
MQAKAAAAAAAAPARRREKTQLWGKFLKNTLNDF